MVKNVNKIKSILEQFPHFEEKIFFLFQSDENFRDICSDYMECSATVDDLKKSLDKNTAKMEEYEDLQRTLEEEILKEILKE